MVWNDTGNQWLNSSKYEYIKNEDGKNTRFIRYKWDSNVNQWMASYNYEYTFDDKGNEIQSLIYNRDTTLSQWLIAAKHEYSWDADGNKIQDLSFDWDTITSQWINREKYDYAYDIYGNRILYIMYRWNKDVSDWSYFDRGFNYYSSRNITEIQGKELTSIRVWPNPADDYIRVDLNPMSGNATFELYDMQGRKLLSQGADINNRISTSRLTSGVYLYRISINTHIFAGKISIRRGGERMTP